MATKIYYVSNKLLSDGMTLETFFLCIHYWLYETEGGNKSQTLPFVSLIEGLADFSVNDSSFYSFLILFGFMSILF